MGTSQDYEGGCQCGAVRYVSTQPPSSTGYCHCRICQRTTGAPFAVGVFFPRDAFRFVRGEPKLYQSSPGVERGFCGRCGSRLTYQSIGADWISVEVGSLDQPDRAPPAYHTGIESQVSWLSIDDHLPRARTGESPDPIEPEPAAEG